MTFTGAYIYKNGTVVARSIATSYSTSLAHASIAVLVYLNGTTDYVELFANVTGTGTCTILAIPEATYMTGSLVRAG